jgi:predicted outer membrane repeat protein
MNIKQSLAELQDGEILELPPGYYTGSDNCGIIIRKSNLTIRGIAGPAQTVIDCASRARHFLILGDNVTIQGIHLLNGAAYARDCSFMTDLGLDCASDSSGGCILVLGERAGMHDTMLSNCSAVNNGGAISAVGKVRLDRVDINSCRAANGGGVWSSGDLVVTSSTLVLNKAFRGGAIFIIGANASLVANEMTLRQNQAQSSGGGIHADGSVSLHLKQGCLIEKNSAGANGGGIYMAMNSNLKVLGNSKFLSNRVTDGSNAYGGGAIHAYEGCKIDISDTAIFEQNIAEASSGGGIRATHGCHISIRDKSKFSRNVGGTGGAICAEQRVTINISDHVVLDENVASSYCGGAIFMSGMSAVYLPLSGPGPMYLFVSGYVTFKQNYAADSGGAIGVSGRPPPPFMTTSHIMLLDNVLFADNSAEYVGGAINAEWSSTLKTVGNVSFLRNRAGTSGGAISAIIESSIALSGTTILSENFAGFQAGAVALDDSDMEIYDNVIFQDNQARFYGGAITATTGSKIKLMNYTSLIENSAQYGGGLYAAQSCQVFITGYVIFSINHAEHGGAISIEQQTYLSVNENAEFYGNDALIQGGAIRSAGSVIELKGNVSFVRNRAGQRGGGIHLEYISNLNIEDDVLLMGNAARKYPWPKQMSFISRTSMYDLDSVCFTYGGALCVLDTSIVVISGRSVVSQNSASSGGAIFVR